MVWPSSPLTQRSNGLNSSGKGIPHQQNSEHALKCRAPTARANRETTPVTIQQNIDRIQTTHIGSLPRPHAVLDMMKAKFAGQPYDQKTYDATITKAVADSVRKQVDCGIDIVTDGEVSKPGFFTYSS